jgi:hypothetical protein
MFDSLKKALGMGDASEEPKSTQYASTHQATLPATQPQSTLPYSKVSQWATENGFSTAELPKGGYQVFGKVGDKPWRVELGKPSRDFIKGSELRARGEMELNQDVAVLVMSRALKNELEKRAYSLYTDSLQTSMDPRLPEEMRWLSMYEEATWNEMGENFYNNYCVLADQRENAVAWIGQSVIDQLLAWPSTEPDVPRVLMLLRGKVYLRMQASESDLLTIEHATRVFKLACESALAAFPGESF